MLRVVAAAKRDLTHNAAAIRAQAGDFATHPEKWCRDAGISPLLWEEWITELGDGFVGWFTRALVPSALERAAIDQLWWAAMARCLASGDPNAAQLKLWADLAGHTEKAIDAPQTPVLDEDEIWAYLRGLGIPVLRAALTMAENDETARVAPAPVP
jgi:hypothetical protein